MSSIKDAMRVIAAEKRIEELGAAIEELNEQFEFFAKQLTEVERKLDALATRPAQQMPQPRPVERR